METIKEAKQFLKANYKEGTKCPCCGQSVKLYKRTITSAMAWGLIIFDKKSLTNDFYHAENIFKDVDGLPSSIRGDFPKLRFWGLIEKYEGDRDDGSPRNGLYRITSKGKSFVRNRYSVPRHAYTYNNKLRKIEGDDITIKDALSNKFNYNQLMRNEY
jgi:hypothetical protein